MILEFKELMKKLESLTDNEIILLEFLAMRFKGIPKPDLMKSSNEILKSFCHTKIKQKDLTLIYKNLNDKKFIHSSYDGVNCHEMLREHLIYRAYCFERFNELKIFIKKRESGIYRWYEYGNDFEAQLNLREALYTGNKSLYKNIKLSMKIRDEIYAGGSYPNTLSNIMAFADPFEILKNMSVSFLLEELPDAINHMQLQHTVSEDISDWLISVVINACNKDLPPPLRDKKNLLGLYTAIELWLCGRSKEIRSLSKFVEGPFKDAVLGILSYSKYKFKDANGLFESALKQLRKQTRKSTLFFNNTAGLIYIISLLQQGEIENIATAQKLITDSLKRTNKSVFTVLFSSIKKPVNQRFSPNVDYTPYDSFNPWTFYEQTDPRGFVDLLVNTFVDKTFIFKNSFEYIKEHLDNYISFIETTPHIQIQSDALCLRAELYSLKKGGRNQEHEKSLPTPSIIFKNSLKPWQNIIDSITRISEISISEHNKKSLFSKTKKRITWRIEEAQYTSDYKLTPYVQVLSKAEKWSAGSMFSIANRYKDGVDNSFVTINDHRVMNLIEGEKNNRKTEAYNYSPIYNFNDAIFALIGNPLVFINESQLIPVTVAEGEVRIEINGADKGIKISMHPSKACDKGYSVIRENSNQITVYKFSKEQKELIKIIGGNGRTLPSDAKKSLSRAVDKVSRVVDVHSKIKSIGNTSRELLTCNDITIRLSPFSEGVCAQLLVQPLGIKGPSFIPATGSLHVFGSVKDKKVTTTRSFKDELVALNDIVKGLGLENSQETEDCLYEFGDKFEALGFLASIENYKNDQNNRLINVEWPKGITLNCTRTLFPKDFKILIKQKNRWLEVAGKLKVSKSRVYEMDALIAGMETEEQGFIRLKDGQFISLSKSLKRYLHKLSSLSEESINGALKVSDASAINLHSLELDAGESTVDAGWKKTLTKIDESPDIKSNVSPKLKATLRDYQIEGYKWLHRLGHLGLGACLADDMGLGKTIQALALLLKRYEVKKRHKPSLIVAPVSVVAGWQKEAHRFAPSLKTVIYSGAEREKILKKIKPDQILLTSYGLLQRDAKKLEVIDFDTIILDEAQYIKNSDSARAKAAFQLKGDFRIVTTGTPVENRLLEFWSIFNFLNPGLLGSRKYFSKHFEKPIQIHDSSYALNSLRWLVKPFILRRIKDEILEELPPKTEIIRYAHMSEDEEAFYESQRKNAAERVAQSDPQRTMIEMITSLTRLRQAACHPRMVVPSLEIGSAKLECLKEILEELKEGGHRALIFSQFVKFLTIVKRWLNENNFTYEYLDGSTTAKKRVTAIDAFQNGDADLFLISTKAGGFGLNLTGADYVIHLDPWWNPAVEDQASDRAHRIGQTKPVTVYKIVTKNSVEEKIIKMHADKRTLAKGLLEGTGKIASMDMQQLLDLLK